MEKRGTKAKCSVTRARDTPAAHTPSNLTADTCRREAEDSPTRALSLLLPEATGSGFLTWSPVQGAFAKPHMIWPSSFYFELDGLQPQRQDLRGDQNGDKRSHNICNSNRKLFLIVYHLLEWLMDVDNTLSPTLPGVHKIAFLPKPFPRAMPPTAAGYRVSQRTQLLSAGETVFSLHLEGRKMVCQQE